MIQMWGPMSSLTRIATKTEICTLLECGALNLSGSADHTSTSIMNGHQNSNHKTHCHNQASQGHQWYQIWLPEVGETLFWSQNPERQFFIHVNMTSDLLTQITATWVPRNHTCDSRFHFILFQYKVWNDRYCQIIVQLLYLHSTVRTRVIILLVFAAKEPSEFEIGARLLQRTMPIYTLETFRPKGKYEDSGVIWWPMAMRHETKGNQSRQCPLSAVHTCFVISSEI